MQNITFEQSNHIATLTINRPDKLNALNFQTLEELKNAIEKCENDATIRGIIITGAGGKAFVAGADINEIADMNEINARKIAENGQEIFANIENSHKLIIACVNGYALGGGCELAMACHLRVASENAVFAQPEINLGIIPGYGGTQRLTQLVGKAKAIELMCTADYVDAKEAYRLGLVNYVLPQDEIMAKCQEIMAKVVSKPRIATGLIIESVNAVYNKNANGYLVEANSFSACTKSGNFKEGTRAFLEKRKPNFD